MNNTIRAVLISLILLPLLFLALLHSDHPLVLRLGTIELILIGVVVNTFVGVYLFRNWRANPYGRAMMYSKISLAVLVDLSLLTTLLGPDFPYRPVVRLLLFGGILFAQSRLLYLLLFKVRKHSTQ